MTYTALVVTDKDEEARFKIPYFALATAAEAVGAAGGILAQTTGSRDEKILASVGTTIGLDLLIAATIALIANADAAN